MRPKWVYKLYKDLKNLDIVDSISLKKDIIDVHYVTGIRRKYIYNLIKRRKYSIEIDETNGTLHWPFDISYEFSWDPLNHSEKEKMSKYFFVSRKHLDKMTEIDYEVLVQYLIHKIDNNHIIPYVPENVEQRSLEQLYDTNKIYALGVFDICRNSRIIKQLLYNYIDIKYKHKQCADKTYAKAFSTNVILFFAFMYAIKCKRYDLTITSLYRMLDRMKYGPRVFNSAAIRAILIQLNKFGCTTLVDLTPNVYEKCISCSMLNMSYATPYDLPPIEFIDRLGVHTLDIKNVNIDNSIAMYDNLFSKTDCDTLKNIVSKYKYSILYVDKDDVREYKKVLSPSRIVKVLSKPTRIDKNINYLFVCNQ